jgi:hypothetical protein
LAQDYRIRHNSVSVCKAATADGTTIPIAHTRTHQGAKQPMSIPETQAHFKSRFWQAIAKSQLDLSPLPAGTVDRLVDLLSEAALLTLDEELLAVKQRHSIASGWEEKSAAPPLSPPTPPSLVQQTMEQTEEILWEGRPFLSLTTHYRITSERLRITYGLLAKQRSDVELVKIQDIDQSQRVTERMINIGDLTIRSNDRTHPVVMLENIFHVQEVHEILRRAVLAARARYNFTFREEM